MEIQGTFNAQRFYETLALLISRRENVKITVTVTEIAEAMTEQEDQQQSKVAV